MTPTPAEDPPAEPGGAELPPDPAAVEAAAQASAEQDAAALEAAEREAHFQRLMQRISAHADFPSLKDSIRSIQKVARSEKAHMRALTEEVLGDVALTNKLLRLINAAYYSSVGGGSITSIPRAVALMGFQAIGMLATSLALFDRLPKGADGERVRQEFGRALLAALLAHELCHSGKHMEGAYITAMFQNLGLMLAGMHFPADAETIDTQLTERGLQGESLEAQEARQQISRNVLGLSYEDLGVEVAGQWGWPEHLQLGMRRLQPSDAERAATPDEYLRVLCTAANRLAYELQQLPQTGKAEERAAARAAYLAGFAAELAIPLSLDPEQQFPAQVDRALLHWEDLGQMLGLTRNGATAAKTASKPAARSTPLSGAQVARPAARPPTAAASNAMTSALTQALEQLSALAMSDAPLGQVLQLVMTQIHGALQLQRIVICMRDSTSGELRGRIGIGERANALAPVFCVPMQPPGDLFGLLCAKGADTLISDATDTVIAQRLPAWFRQQVKAPTFVLLPLLVNNQAMGLIYGDRAQANSLVIGERELTLLKALRNQLIMAMRLRGIAG